MKILFISDVPLENPSSGAEMVLNQQAIGLSDNKSHIFAITRSNEGSFNIKSTKFAGVKVFSYTANPNSIFIFISDLSKNGIKMSHKTSN